MFLRFPNQSLNSCGIGTGMYIASVGKTKQKQKTKTTKTRQYTHQEEITYMNKNPQEQQTEESELQKLQLELSDAYYKISMCEAFKEVEKSIKSMSKKYETIKKITQIFKRIK